ncbi:MAG: apolipoprotein N-acyltransferase [Verrucomicrobiales bacterium]|nr:apolipoprotein N-acyltransferase [Verrucomicrobiales bacterium]
MAFHPVAAAVLGWIAPGMLLIPGMVARMSPARIFRLGYLAGLVHHLAALVWLLWNPFPAGAFAGWFALSAYLALYPATWAWLCERLAVAADVSRRKSPPEPPIASAAPNRSRESCADCTSAATASWPLRALWGFGCAALWVGFEMLRARLFTGFPWNPLGSSQVENLPLIQFTAFTGVYGVSFLLVWTSASGLLAGLRFRAALVESGSLPGGRAGSRHPSRRGRGSLVGTGLSRLLPDLFLPALAVAGVLAYGGSRLLSPEEPAGRGMLRVALVQPAIPQRLIFDPAESSRRFEDLLALTDRALATHPDLLVWPEAALPSLSEDDYRRLYDRVHTGGAWMVFGADDTAPNPDATGGYDWFNAAFLLDPTGTLQASYRKQQLVIFGEYVPLARWLPWLERLTPVSSSFARGSGPAAFRLSDPPASCAPLICYEDVFPRVARRAVAADTDFLLNLTNDAWFGETAEHWQHLACATFRAVENGVPLVRCANNGISGWVTPRGAWRELGFGPGTRVYDRGFKTVEIPLRLPGRAPTFYTRHGDLFGWLCSALGGVFAALTFWPRPR